MASCKYTLDIWDPVGYSKHSSIQKAAAADIISLLEIRGDEHVVDVGCGDGSISAAIAHSVPRGKVCGIDISESMIKFAKINFPDYLYPNLSFHVLDGQELPFQNELGLVFSCFAIQWFSNPEKFFKRAYMALHSRGKLGITLPLCISPKLSKSLKRVCELSEWASYFLFFDPGWRFQAKRTYEKILDSLGFITELSNEITCNKEFSSEESLKLYISQWLTHLKVLPEDKREAFLDAVITDYLQLTNSKRITPVTLEFPRLDIIASKP